jgi:hypothetical protein
VRKTLPRSLKCVRTVLGTHPDVSLGRSDSQVVYLFIIFPMMLISSQSYIWSESYDRNTRGRSDGLTERPDDQLQPPFQNSAESFHIKAMSGRCCPSVRTVALALPRIASGREHHIIRTVCRCLPISVSETETLLLVELWMSSGRYCHVVQTDVLEHWILLELLIASGRFAIMSGRMQSWTVQSF